MSFADLYVDLLGKRTFVQIAQPLRPEIHR
jgi:hypothetical protein